MNLTLIGNSGQDLIEGRLTVGGNQQTPAVGKVIGIAYFAAVKIGKFFELGIDQTIVDDLLRIGIGHFFCHFLFKIGKT